jgi:hypothetical protein
MVNEDAIRQRAYYLWEADGRPDGRHDHYWNLAHAEATKLLVGMKGNGSAATAPKAAKTTKAKEAKPVKLKAAKAEAKPAKKAAPKPRAAPTTHKAK